VLAFGRAYVRGRVPLCCRWLTRNQLVVRRFRDVALARELHWRDRLTIRGVDHLPLSW
jgi:hypothetical protein